MTEPDYVPDDPKFFLHLQGCPQMNQWRDVWEDIAMGAPIELRIRLHASFEHGGDMNRSGHVTRLPPRPARPAGPWVVGAALALAPNKDTTMARTAKLSDLHYVLLATAAARATGSLLPPASKVEAARASITKAIKALIRQGLAEEVESKNAKSVWREEDGHRFAVVITDAGRAAIRVGDGNGPDVELIAPAATEVQPEPILVDPLASEAAAITARPGTKHAVVIDLLQRKQGASITELTDATGWLPHTTRAALTGLRKRGLPIANEKVDGVSRYRATAAGAR